MNVRCPQIGKMNINHLRANHDEHRATHSALLDVAIALAIAAVVLGVALAALLALVLGAALAHVLDGLDIYIALAIATSSTFGRRNMLTVKGHQLRIKNFEFFVRACCCTQCVNQYFFVEHILWRDEDFLEEAACLCHK